METKKLRKRELDNKTKKVKGNESRKEKANQTERVSCVEKKVIAKLIVRTGGMSPKPNGARGGIPCRSTNGKEPAFTLG